MIKYLFMLFILSNILFSLAIDNKTTNSKLLKYAEIYIDNNKSETIFSIQNKEFKKNNKEELGFGYSPHFNVWIKFTLTNKTAQPIEKILEYDNPLSSYVNFYDGEVLLKKDGLLAVAQDRKSLNPVLKIKLKPNESKLFFIKASSSITTLIVKLNLWSSEDFKDKERKNQLLLALFFGAMGIIILYNSIIFLATKEFSYLYYVLFFATVSFHHFMYKGIGTLCFSSETMQRLIENSSFIVAMPMFFLALFVQQVLVLKQYPKLNKILNYLLIAYLIAIVLIVLTHQYQYRSLFLMFTLITLLYMAIYALIKKNRQAYYVIGGLVLLSTSGLFMYLSSAGIYDIFEYFPYYTEFSLVAEIGSFSLALASKIKMLNQEKVKSQERALLLKELKHRMQNNIQFILSFLILQRDEISDRRTEEILTNLEHRILATSELYALLEVKDEISIVNMRSYFSLIITNIQKSFKANKVKIEIDANVEMNSKYAIYCGLIVNEAVTNAVKYAFNSLEDGVINIVLQEKKKRYYLTIKDNGSGFKKNSSDGLGMSIIDTLATIQLEGTLQITQEHGTKIAIEWRKHDR
ncbi:Signal Transduction Histidine Kinase [hydrothermal vent metagenome]|uniref:histidine kinase n=1 Tax=hydrothermal vent metagenome TaxID=652676 RepID=A0A1W1CGH7_9ZZZZ